MKQKLTNIVLGVLGLSFFTGCCCVQTQRTYHKCLPCENAKAAMVTPTYAPAPDPAPQPVRPDNNCLPCQQQAQVQYVAPTPKPAPAPPAPKPVCLPCVNGQPDYSAYQWE